MKFFVETYGCQMNVADSELVTSILISAGFEAVTDIDNADLIIFNTCSVRKHAEDRVLGRISNEKHRKLAKPDLKIAVIGCMAQRVGDTLVKNGSGVDYVIGVDQYHEFPRILSQDSDEHVFTTMDTQQTYPGIMPSHGNNTCGFVTIMRGCNNFCTYCIVPYVRGRERSRSFREVYDDVRIAADNGLRDITLLGQNVNSYFSDSHDFPELLDELCEIENLFRLRFITSHPKDLSDSLIEVMAKNSKICKHIHLPLQSGDNEILSIMNRNYTIEHYHSLVTKLRNAVPDIAITTDLIAGFPNESDAQFEHTLAAMHEIGFDYAFCFKFSPREGTKASTMLDQVEESVRLARLQEMIILQRQITLDKFSAMIGREVEIYVEGLSKKSATQISGKTEDYKIAVATGTENQIGTLVRVKVIAATAGTLICS